MKRLIAVTILLAAAVSAGAGELSLFSQPGFRGSEVTLRGGASNFRDLGFNDRASSMIVRSGVWEVCEHKDFGGHCAVFEPGEYPLLERFNNSISSAREMPGRPHRGQWRDGERRDYGWRDHGWREEEPVVLFSANRFEGERIAVRSGFRTLRDIGFNDRARSLIINDGEWEFCEHADFRGRCVVLGPGRYAWLDEMNNQLSSLRRVR